MDWYAITVHTLSGDVILQSQSMPSEMKIFEIKKQCLVSSSPRLMSLTAGSGQNKIVLQDHETLKSVAPLVADAAVTLCLIIRPLKILIIEGMGMMSPDHNADTDSVLEALGDMEADSDDECNEINKSYKEILSDERRTVTCFKYHLDDLSRIKETQSAITESDVTVLCESHVCPSKVSDDLDNTLLAFVQMGGWFLHTGPTDMTADGASTECLFPSFFRSLPRRRLRSTKAASVGHLTSCAQLNPMYQILQSVREGKTEVSEQDRAGLEAECAKFGFDADVLEGDHANAYAYPTENESFERLFPESASLKVPGNFLCFCEEEINPAHSYFRMSTGYGVPVVSMPHGQGRVTSFGALPNHTPSNEESGFPLALVLAAHLRAAESLVGTACPSAAELHSGMARGQKRRNFHQGMKVEATGLSRRADLNGKVGTVRGRATGSDKNPRIVVVFIVDGVEESMMCRPENLK